MNKKKLVVAISFIGLLSITVIAYATSNLNLSKSNINRFLPDAAKLVSATVNLSHLQGTETIYVTQKTGDFVLNNFCSSPVLGGGMQLASEGFGIIAQTTANNLCYTFNPGIIMPRGVSITCSTTPGTTFALSALPTSSSLYFCTISGYFSPDLDGP